MVGKCILSHWVGFVSMLFIHISISNNHWYFKPEGLSIAIILQFVFWSWIIINSWEWKVYKPSGKDKQMGQKIP